MSDTELEQLRAKVARVEALADLWNSWDGTRPHPGESSPHQREQLRAALDGPEPEPKRHAVKTDIVWLGSGRDGDPWAMGSWDVKWCDCDQPWRHEALA